jgi:hypothetical protein
MVALVKDRTAHGPSTGHPHDNAMPSSEE